MKQQLTALLCLMSTYAHAHPGHNHQHWLSDPIHALTALAVAAIPVVAYTMIRLKKSKEQ